MEINVSVLLIIFFVLFFILFIWGMRIKRIQKKLKKEKERLVEEYYPDLTAADKKYRQTSITHYYHSYFKGLSKFYLAIPYIFLLLLILLIICIFHINMWGTWAMYLCLSMIMILFPLYSFLTPSLEKQQAFWEEYLKKNPENPLKVVLFPIEKSKQLVKFNRITDLYFLFYGIYTLFMAIVLFFSQL
jgi:low affinity Fe/Cu permease